MEATVALLKVFTPTQPSEKYVAFASHRRWECLFCPSFWFFCIFLTNLSAMNEQVRRVGLGGGLGGGVHGSADAPHRLQHHRLLRRPRKRRGGVRGHREVGGRGGQRVASLKIHNDVNDRTQDSKHNEMFETIVLNDTSVFFFFSVPWYGME